MCDAIYIGNTQQTSKKILDGHFSDLQRLFKNGQKPDSFDAHFVQDFDNTTSRTDLGNKSAKSDWRDGNIYKT